jgi:hypothetical protein
MHEKPTNTPIIHSNLLIMYGSSYMFRHYIAIFRERSYCLLRDAQLRSSRLNIVDGRVVFSDVVRDDLRLPRICWLETVMSTIRTRVLSVNFILCCIVVL